ncbi:MAG TPA: hypothetical protein VGL61_18490 [Kofleriaceae bacterium]|jgi:hypothetical protein
MTRISVISLMLLAAGCKGETVTKDNPQTLADLDNCKRSSAEKDKLIDAERAENATLLRGGGSAAEIIVSIEGNVLTVKPAADGEPQHAIPDKVTAAASQEFLDLVAKSRGGIQKCYTLALKKRSDLQARTVTVTVSATFASSGAYQDASFSPSLGDVFDSCMKTLASKWTLPANSPAMTFRAPVSLTPS